MSLWIGIALVVVVVVALLAWQRRPRGDAPPVVEAPREAERTSDDAPPVPEAEEAVVEPPIVGPPVMAPAAIQAPPVEPHPVTVSPVVVAPPAPVAPPVAPAVPAAVVAPPDPVTIAPQPRTTAKPPPPLELVARVLVLERATPVQWEAATAIETVEAASPFADSLTGSLQRQMMPSSSGAGLLYRARFERGDALALAQANLVDLKERVERREAARGMQPDPSRDPAFASWLDGAASAALAGQALAAWSRARHIGPLDAESGEIKAAIQSPQARLDAEALRLLKGASQDLSRFLREAREGYAAALRKPVFLERVQAACSEASHVWARLEARLDAIRTMLAAQADAPRLGEVQLERSLAALRALADERRVQVLGARLLGAIHGVQVALGAPRPKPGESALQQALARWRSAAAAERELLDRLIERVRTAKAPDYAGKGEFESNRAAARAAYERLVAGGANAAGPTLEAACAAEARGFLDGEADEFTLYMRVAPDGRIVEWRRAPLERDARPADASRQAAAAR